MDLSGRIERFRLRQSEIDAEQSAQREEFDSLIARIKAGESTGDQITDFAIAHKHSLKPEAEEEYRRLNALVVNHIGNPFLAVKIEKRPKFSHGSDETYSSANYSLGVLSDKPKFLLNSDEIVFPTDGRYVFASEAFTPTWGLEKKDLRFSPADGYKIPTLNLVNEDDEWTGANSENKDKHDEGFELYFGQTDVKNSLRRFEPSLNYEAGMSLLDKPLMLDESGLELLTELERLRLIGSDSHEIKPLLETALKLRLDKADYKVSRGKDISLDVGAFVRGLKKEYHIN